ncbi:MAG TPA: hypothetical protein VGB79_15965 [Allosphingosinicella sp.]|jgi:hypothetical protein
MSPDGSRVAYWHAYDPAAVEIAPLDASPSLVVPNSVTFRSFSSGIGLGSEAADALAWAGDSRSLWAVRQDRLVPGGWAVSGLRPVRIGPDGTIRDLPLLRHEAGPLDALMWIGHSGLALAQFGTRGSRYRPEHEDPAPTFAIVDASRGEVRDSVRLDRIEALRERLRDRGTFTGGAAAAILPDGRIKMVVHFPRTFRPRAEPGEPDQSPGLWFVWTEGEEPRHLPTPPAETRGIPFGLSRDGSKLLMSRMLWAEGYWRISCRIPCRTPPPPRPPVSGSVAELIDLESGRTVWRIEGDALGAWAAGHDPVVSPDGGHALVELPPDEDGGRVIALVSMRDGRILGRIAPTYTSSYPHRFGFRGDGRAIWVAVGGSVLVYALEPTI